jgi:hypothetical protein
MGNRVAPAPQPHVVVEKFCDHLKGVIRALLQDVNEDQLQNTVNSSKKSIVDFVSERSSEILVFQAVASKGTCDS